MPIATTPTTKPTLKLSALAYSITESQTMAMGAIAAKLKASGRDIITLSAGELDCDTPEFAKRAGIAAIEHNQTRYTINAGTLELRQEICNRYQRDLGLSYSPNQVLVTAGAKQAIYNTLLALCGPGDEVIAIAPYWVSYPEQIAMTGARMIRVETSVADGFQIALDDIRRAITPRTKVVILNSPNNPTGAVYPKETIFALAELCVERHVWLMSDEIYEKILFPPARHWSPAQASPAGQARTVIVNGFSKTYAMTGWRIGFAIGDERIISAANKIQSHSTSNASSISQAAALGALRKDDGSFFRELIPRLVARCDSAIAILKENRMLRISQPQGAYYLMIDVSQAFGKTFRGQTLNSGYDTSMYLLEAVGVAVTAGEAFGAQEYVRLSFAADSKLVDEGCRRIVRALTP